MISQKLFATSSAVLLLMGAVATSPALAQQAPQPQPTQTQLSEGQISRFVIAYQAVQTIRAEAQPEFIAAVEAEGLTVEEFNAIAEAQQNPETTAQISPEQAEQFTAAVNQLTVIQEEVQAEMQVAIQDAGLTIEEYQAILGAAQQDETLRQQINEQLETTPQ